MVNYLDVEDRVVQTVMGTYFQDVVKALDEEFGEGYARKNPALVASILNTCVKEYEVNVNALIEEGK